MLFSVKKQKHGGGKLGAAAERDTDRAGFEVAPVDVAPPVREGVTRTPEVELGVLDLEFTRTRPTYVELCLVFQSPLIPDIFRAALRASLESFPSAAGRRNGTRIRGAAGVRFSAIAGVDCAALLSRPPHSDLFDMPDRHTILKRSDAREEDNQVLTLRLTTGKPVKQSGHVMCALGIVFDHALCDVGGLGILLAHISHNYATIAIRHRANARPSPAAPLAPGNATDTPVAASPAPPTNDRAKQSLVQLKSADLIHGSSTVTAPPPAPPRLKGGVACVDIVYHPDLLSRLKAEYSAASRHEAAYTDVILLLQSAGQTPPMRAATVSRDDRARSGLGVEHFGNGVVMVDADFSDAALNGDGCGVAASLRAAVSAGVGRPASAPAHTADIHLNTWWHPLQRDLSFGMGVQPSFAIGPGSLCASGQICIARGGQPNVTIVPSVISGGLRASLLTPLRVAYAVQRAVLRRERKLGYCNKDGVANVYGKSSCGPSRVNEINTEKKIEEVCRNFARGRCRKGSSCSRLHIASGATATKDVTANNTRSCLRPTVPWVLSCFLNESSDSIDDQVRFALQGGLGYIDVGSVDGTGIACLSDSIAQRMRAKLERSGIRVNMLRSTIGNCSLDDGPVEEDLDRLDRLATVGKILGCNRVRVFSYANCTVGTALNEEARLAATLQRLARLKAEAVRLGLVLFLENEGCGGLFGGTANHMHSLLAELYDPGVFGAIFNVDSYLQSHEDVWRAWECLRGFTDVFHLKAINKKVVVADSGREYFDGVMLGTGNGQVVRILHDAKGRRFQGSMSIEPQLTRVSVGLKTGPHGNSVESLNEKATTLRITVDAVCRIFSSGMINREGDR